jgi:hypothetical protein
LHDARTSLKVVPVVALSEPNAGTVSVGQGLAEQEGRAALHEPAVVQVSEVAPTTLKPAAQLKVTTFAVTPHRMSTLARTQGNLAPWQVGTAADHAPDVWHVRLAAPTRVYPALQDAVTTSAVTPVVALSEPNEGTVSVGHGLAEQVGEAALQLPAAVQVSDVAPTTLYPTAQLKVTTVAVTPLSAEKVPNGGFESPGHGLAWQVGTAADQEPEVMQTRLPAPTRV